MLVDKILGGQKDNKLNKVEIEKSFKNLTQEIANLKRIKL